MWNSLRVWSSALDGRRLFRNGRLGGVRRRRRGLAQRSALGRVTGLLIAMGQDQRGGLHGARCGGCLLHTNQRTFTNFNNSEDFAQF